MCHCSSACSTLMLQLSGLALSKAYVDMQIDGHGNFGSVDSDPPAAMRYTECRLQHFSTATFLTDLDSDTVDFLPNFDASQVRYCCGNGVMSTAMPSHIIVQQQSSLRALPDICNLAQVSHAAGQMRVPAQHVASCVAQHACMPGYRMSPQCFQPGFHTCW